MEISRDSLEQFTSDETPVSPKDAFKNSVRARLEGFIAAHRSDIEEWADDNDYRDYFPEDVDGIFSNGFDFFVDKMYDEKWNAEDAYSFLRWSEGVDPRIPEAMALRRMKRIEAKYNKKMAEEPSAIEENSNSKITKARLNRIIKEEKAKILKEMNYEQKQRHFRSRHHDPQDGVGNTDMTTVGPGDDPMGSLHTAIDNLIRHLGNDAARMELQGIVDDWNSEDDQEAFRMSQV